MQSEHTADCRSEWQEWPAGVHGSVVSAGEGDLGHDSLLQRTLPAKPPNAAKRDTPPRSYGFVSSNRWSETTEPKRFG
jgi:hypothetical protein